MKKISSKPTRASASAAAKTKTKTKPKAKAKAKASTKPKAQSKAKRPVRTAAGRRTSAAAVEEWSLRLYVAGQSPKSVTAFANLKRLCDEHLPGRHRIEVIDLVKNPRLAQGDQIVAVPTLVRKLPQPIRRVIGDLSNTERVLVGMDFRPLMPQPKGTP